MTIDREWVGRHLTLVLMIAAVATVLIIWLLSHRSAAGSSTVAYNPPLTGIDLSGGSAGTGTTSGTGTVVPTPTPTPTPTPVPTVPPVQGNVGAAPVWYVGPMPGSPMWPGYFGIWEGSALWRLGMTPGQAPTAADLAAWEATIQQLILQHQQVMYTPTATATDVRREIRQLQASVPSQAVSGPVALTPLRRLLVHVPASSGPVVPSAPAWKLRRPIGPPGRA